MNADGLAFLERLENLPASARERRWDVVNRCAAYAESDKLSEYLLFSEAASQKHEDFGVSLIIYLLLKMLMR